MDVVRRLGVRIEMHCTNTSTTTKKEN